MSTSALSSSNLTPKIATDDVPVGDPNKTSYVTSVQSDNISNADTTQIKEAVNNMLVKKAQEKETPTDTKEGALRKEKTSEATAVMEDQKSAVPQPEIYQELSRKPADSNSEIKNVLEKPEQLQSKASAPEVEISKQESGFFGFGFGGSKIQSTPSKGSDTGAEKIFAGVTEAPLQESAFSVSGKVLGLGSSIFSSASNLISSAVNDEPSITPLRSRKGSTVSQTDTTPASRKGSTVSQASLKTPPSSRKGSATSQTSLKTSPIVDTKPSDSLNQDKQALDDKSKVKLDGDSLEPAKPPDSEKHIEMSPTTSELKLDKTSTVCVDKKIVSITEAAKIDKQKPSLNENIPQQKAQVEKDDKSQKQVKKAPESPARSTPPLQAEAQKQSSFFGFGISTGKTQPTPSKSSESTTGKLFGFAGLTETARSRSPSPQSMTNAPGKLLGFGSTIFSSASNLISSAIQDESSPPRSRKGSTVSQSSIPPSSRKSSIVPTAEPKDPISTLDDKPVEKSKEESNVTKSKLTVTEKQEAMSESAKMQVPSKSSSKASQTTCPLCKVDLNVGSEELPNYNTCTECKEMVCNLCGFIPMPRLAEVSYFSDYFIMS